MCAIKRRVLTSLADSRERETSYQMFTNENKVSPPAQYRRFTSGIGGVPYMVRSVGKAIGAIELIRWVWLEKGVACEDVRLHISCSPS